MPVVGKKKFAYTPAGKRAAKSYGKKTGKKLKTSMARHTMGMIKK